MKMQLERLLAALSEYTNSAFILQNKANIGTTARTAHETD